MRHVLIKHASTFTCQYKTTYFQNIFLKSFLFCLSLFFSPLKAEFIFIYFFFELLFIRIYYLSTHEEETIFIFAFNTENFMKIE